MNVKTNVGKTFFKLLQKHFPSNHPMNHPTLKFSIAKRVKGNTFINNCNLCLSEKVFIIRNLDDENMLNKKVRIYIKVPTHKYTIIKQSKG